jgi:hypothetical protein
MVSRLRAVLPFALIVAGIVILGAALRFYAIDFGMAYPRARPDEGTAIGHAVDILAGDPNPHFFNWPSFTLYVFAAAFALAKAAGVALTGPHHVLIARTVVALAGTATLFVTMAIGRSLVDRGTGACAALFLAVAPLHVRDSHFAMTDVLMTLLVTLSVALTMRGVETRRRGLAAAGVAGGSRRPRASAGSFSRWPPRPRDRSAGSRRGWGRFWRRRRSPSRLLHVQRRRSYERAYLSGGHIVLSTAGCITCRRPCRTDWASSFSPPPCAAFRSSR